jgi:hypothetical protein
MIIQEETYKLLDSMIDLSLKRRFQLGEHYLSKFNSILVENYINQCKESLYENIINLFGVSSYLKSYATINFGLGRQVGTTTSSIRLVNKYFKNPCFIFSTMRYAKYYKTDKLITNNCCSINNFHSYIKGKSFDSVIVDIESYHLTYEDREQIYRVSSFLLNKNNFDRFTVIFLG